jgi:hypothetical protein
MAYAGKRVVPVKEPSNGELAKVHGVARETIRRWKLAGKLTA